MNALKPLLFAVLCLTTSAAVAADPLVAQPGSRYRPGDRVRCEIENESRQTLTLAGMPLETKSTRFAVLIREAVEVSAERVKLRNSFERLQVDVDLPMGESLNYDSGRGAEDFGDGPIADIRKLLKVSFQTPWTVTIENGKAVAVEIDEQALEEIPESMRGDFSADRLLELENLDLNRLPDEPVSPGDSWERAEEMPLGQGQIFHIRKTYTYVGREERGGRMLDRVRIKPTALRYSLRPGSALPLSVKDSDLAIVEGAGELWFDPETQRTVELTESMQVTGSLMLVIAEQELPSQLELTMKQRAVEKPQ